MPELPKSKLSEQPVVGTLGPRARLPVLLAAQDEPDPTRRNPTAGVTTLRVWLGLGGATAVALVDVVPGDPSDDDAPANFVPAPILYAISSLPANAPDPYDGPTWNGAPQQQTVLVQGLPGGTWASEGLLVLDGGGSQRVDVDVTAGTYTPQGAGAGTVTSVDGIAPDGTGDVQLPASDIYPSQAKRQQVVSLFTAGTQLSAADAPLAGDPRSDYLFAEFYDFGADYWYKCLPNPTAPDAQGNATTWWVRR